MEHRLERMCAAKLEAVSSIALAPVGLRALATAVVSLSLAVIREPVGASEVCLRASLALFPGVAQETI